MAFTDQDHIWMRRALGLASEGAGSVSPNPMVGCVIVSKSGNVIGEGYHERFGSDHAEVSAVNSVRNREELEGATLYVTLEPCSHQGKTPPCSELLATLPLSRVVVAMQDPNPKVDGRGLKRLVDAGLRVETGLLQSEAGELNRFYLHHLQFKRPYVTLKIAQSADGYITAPNGDARWITGIESRRQVHRWRSIYDAVMVGRNTAELDNPVLSVRHVEGRQPCRVVIDGPRTLSTELNLFSDRYEEKTIVVTWNREKVADEIDPMLRLMKSNYFRGKVLLVDKADGHVDLDGTLLVLGKEGITSLLVEGGQSLSSALLREGLVDQIELFVAPKLLGGGSRSVVGIGVERMEDVRPFRSVEWTRFGEDMLLTAKY